MRLGRLARCKHSSLFHLFIGDEVKSFDVINIFFFITNVAAKAIVVVPGNLLSGHYNICWQGKEPSQRVGRCRVRPYWQNLELLEIAYLGAVPDIKTSEHLLKGKAQYN
jgi:hypothetical protein